MTYQTDELRDRLLDVIDPATMPVDLVERVHTRARRTRARRITGAVVGTAAVVAASIAVPIALIGPAGLGSSQLSSLVAAGNQPVQRYHGPGIPADLRHTALWVIGHGYSAPEHEVIVSYATGGHPCVGDITWSPPPPGSKYVSSGFEGDCSESSALGKGFSYGPVGSGGQMGTEAYLYGAVPNDVRVVRADVTLGYLTERYAATVATAADSAERFVVFYSPGGSARGIKARLTYYDVNGNVVGTAHVSDAPGAGNGPKASQSSSAVPHRVGGDLPYPVKFVNDTRMDIVVRGCTTCGDGHQLAPGATWVTGLAGGLANIFFVRLDGRRFGCVHEINGAIPPKGAPPDVIKVSQTAPCRS
ncbi:MAG: hypothetical protein ACTHK4_12140 [Mycobacteriales bacterium]